LHRWSFVVSLDFRRIAGYSSYRWNSLDFVVSTSHVSLFTGQLIIYPYSQLSMVLFVCYMSDNTV
jgi:hypothetical protein